MPMQTVPPVPSNRPQTAWERYMTNQGSGAAASTQAGGGLAAVRSAATRSAGEAPQATPAMRQALTQGAPQTIAEDLRGVVREYENWATRMRAQGWTDAQIARSPMFETYQSRIVALNGGIKDPELLKSQIESSNARVAKYDARDAEGYDPTYGPSARIIQESLASRQKQLEAAAAPPPVETAPVNPGGTGGAGAVVDPEIQAMLDAYANAPPGTYPAAPSTTAVPAAPAATQAIVPAASTPAAPATARTASISAPAPMPTADTSVESSLSTDGPPMDLNNVRPMPMPTPIYPADMPTNQVDTMRATRPAQTPTGTTVPAPAAPPRRVTQDKLSQLRMASPSTMIGASAPPRAQAISAPSVSSPNLTNPNPSAPPREAISTGPGAGLSAISSSPARGTEDDLGVIHRIPAGGR